MLKAIIVDDEKHCVDHLVGLIQKYHLEIMVVGDYQTVPEAKKAIEQLHPDVVFLDVQLQNETSFDLLGQLQNIDFEIVFTTAYDTYAMDAFKFSALDYLLKPIEPSDFEMAFMKIRQKMGLKDVGKKLEVLFHNFETRKDSLKKIGVPTMEGIDFLSVSEIVHCQSEGNYTHLHVSNNRKILSSKPLKYFEELLEPYHFFRTHYSHLVNLHMVKKYLKGKGGYVVMTDGSSIEIAVRRKEAFLKKLNGTA